jgi:hydrogenase nickel incorporation protein HypA/HybF
MHELSIAVNIVSSLEDIVRKEHATRVVAFTLKIGTLSGIVPEALNFALESAVKGSLCEGSKWEMETEEAIGKCSMCLHEFPLQEIYLPCPVCGAFNPEIISGQGLKIVSVEIEEQEISDSI